MPASTDLATIPSDMDNSPRADEEIIDQKQGDTRPSFPPAPDRNELTDSITLAVDGSGVGLPVSTREQGAPDNVTTEGTTGAGLG